MTRKTSNEMTAAERRDAVCFGKRGGGGVVEVTLCQSEGTHQIVMSFSPPVVGCLFKKSLQKGEGVTGAPGPPWLRSCFCLFSMPGLKYSNTVVQHSQIVRR